MERVLADEIRTFVQVLLWWLCKLNGIMIMIAK